jgi:hypothetical protein
MQKYHFHRKISASASRQNIGSNSGSGVGQIASDAKVSWKETFKEHAHCTANIKTNFIVLITSGLRSDHEFALWFCAFLLLYVFAYYARMLCYALIASNYKIMHYTTTSNGK